MQEIHFAIRRSRIKENTSEIAVNKQMFAIKTENSVNPCETEGVFTFPPKSG